MENSDLTAHNNAFLLIDFYIIETQNIYRYQLISLIAPTPSRSFYGKLNITQLIWHKLLFNDNRVIAGNKLRTYRKIKTDFKREQYLYADVDKKSLSNFIKIRVSNCNLNIEKGRYLKLPVEQRICQLCDMDVEDKFHLLINCDKLIHERVTLFRNISDIVPSFTTMSDVEKFVFIN